MPSQSKTQQRLMGVAYAVKKGDMQISDVDSDYRDKVKDLVSGMTLKQLKGFAETKHEGLPEVVENISIDSVGGIGPVKLPTSTENGSGDVPAGQGDAEEEYKKKKRKMKHLNNFESFVNEAKTGEYPQEVENIINELVKILPFKKYQMSANNNYGVWFIELPVTAVPFQYLLDINKIIPSFVIGIYGGRSTLQIRTEIKVK